MIGSLGYLIYCRWPDIVFAVRKLGLYTVCLSEKYLLTLKDVFQYVKVMIYTGMIIGAYSNIPDVSAYFDASFVDDPDDHRSTFGYTIQFGNTMIFWKLKKHKAITLYPPSILNM